MKSGVGISYNLDLWADSDDCWSRRDDYAYWTQQTTPQQVKDNILLALADVRRLPLADESFDLIFSIATFEHIHDMDVALKEMHRLLKPHGVLFSHFGPVWSGGVGHHLWFDWKGQQYRFSEEQTVEPLMQRFEHMLYSPEEMAERWRQQGIEEEDIQQFIFQFYISPHINRYTEADYRQFVDQSPFRVISLRRSWTLPPKPEMLEKLQKKYGYLIDFSCSGLEIVLQK